MSRRVRIDKKLKEDKALKNILKRDIAKFMVDFKMQTHCDFEGMCRSMLEDGFKGYDTMRNKDLLNEFEEVYTKLYDPNLGFMVYRKSYSYGYESLRDEELQEVVFKMKQDAESLMTRIFEAATLL